MSTWTEDKVEILTAGWAAGHTASRIAADLGRHWSRNAVIGKAHRMGLEKRREKITKPIRPRKMRFVPSIPSTEATDIIPIGGDFIPHHQRKTLVELTARSCRWPIGDPTERDFFFCGAEAVEGLPYCPSHSRRAFVKHTRRDGAASSDRGPKSRAVMDHARGARLWV